ncbi:MAG: protein phosphatase 2C domain-containing protein [Gemmatimonadota bacterium]
MIETVVEPDADEFELRASQTSGRNQFASITLAVKDHDLRVHLGYRRCLVFDADDRPGQDAGVIKGDATHAVAVIADGVGQSYFGNLASSYLSEWLLSVLWQRRHSPPTEEEFVVSLREQEKVFAPTVDDCSHTVRSRLHQAALDRARAKGSQTVFAALLLDVVTAECHLYQVGDVKAIVFLEDGSSQDVDSDAAGRWSSKGRTALCLRHTKVSRVSRIVLKTDGASADWGRSTNALANDAIAFDMMAAACAPDDDVAVAQIALARATVPAGSMPSTAPLVVRPAHSLDEPTTVPSAPLSDSTEGTEEERCELERSAADCSEVSVQGDYKPVAGCEEDTASGDEVAHMSTQLGGGAELGGSISGEDAREIEQACPHSDASAGAATADRPEAHSTPSSTPEAADAETKGEAFECGGAPLVPQPEANSDPRGTGEYESEPSRQQIETNVRSEAEGGEAHARDGAAAPALPQAHASDPECAQERASEAAEDLARPAEQSEEDIKSDAGVVDTAAVFTQADAKRVISQALLGALLCLLIWVTTSAPGNWQEWSGLRKIPAAAVEPQGKPPFQEPRDVRPVDTEPSAPLPDTTMPEGGIVSGTEAGALLSVRAVSRQEWLANAGARVSAERQLALERMPEAMLFDIAIRDKRVTHVNVTAADGIAIDAATFAIGDSGNVFVAAVMPIEERRLQHVRINLLNQGSTIASKGYTLRRGGKYRLSVAAPTN